MNVSFCLSVAEVTPLAEAPSDTHLPPPPPAPADEVDLAALPPPPDFLLEEHHGDAPHQQPGEPSTGVKIPERSLSVADAVKTLNEIRHQPASPGVVRRAQSMRATPTSNSTGDAPDPRLLIQLAAAVNTGNKVGPATAPKTGRHHHHPNHGHPNVHHHQASTLHHSSSMKNSPKTPIQQQFRTLPKHLPSQSDLVRT